MTPASGGVLGVAEVLDRAADLIEPEGRWTQHRYSDGDGEVGESLPAIRSATCWCAEGAIARILDVSGEEADGWVLRRCRFFGDLGGYGALVEFNDHPRRTQAEVVAALRSAAEAARAGEA